MTMRNLKTAVALGAALMAVAGAAHATPFDLEGLATGFTAGPIVVNDGALMLTITVDGGGSFLYVDNPSVALLGQRGVIGSNTNPLQVDQFAPIRFSFNQTINSITFNFGDSGGDNDSPVNISAYSLANVLLGTAVGSYPAGASAGASLTLNFAGASYFLASSGVQAPGNNANSIFWDIGDVQSNGAGGVPEPATWAMMLVGFGGLGAVMRRRRTAATLAA